MRAFLRVVAVATLIGMTLSNALADGPTTQSPAAAVAAATAPTQGGVPQQPSAGSYGIATAGCAIGFQSSCDTKNQLQAQSAQASVASGLQGLNQWANAPANGSGTNTAGTSGTGTSGTASGTSNTNGGGGSGNGCGNGASTRFDAIVACLQDNSACWSCELYESVFFGMRSIVSKSYAYFVGSGTSGSVSALALATTMLGIAVLVKVLPIAMGIGDHRETAAKLRMFFLRVAIAFGVFLTSDAASMLTYQDSSGSGQTTAPSVQLADADGTGSTSGGSTSGSSSNVVSDWFIDGPLALGTQIATDLSTVASNALNSSGGSSSGGSSGSTSNLMTGATLTNSSPSSDAGSLGTTHVTAAKSMLLNLHKLGVAGIATGLWMCTEGAPSLVGSNLITAGAAFCVGLMMAWLFFMFTLTFGLRYIDALIRSMLIFSLMPIFVFLWIFDSTRRIATDALRAGLALAAVFAVSGVVFTVACFILGLGIQKAFNTGGGGLDTQSLQKALSQIQGGAFNFLSGSSGSASTLNWLSLFYLAGSASLSISCAKLAFELAQHLFATGSSHMGMGEKVENEIHQVADMGKGKIIGAVTGAVG